VDNDLLVTPLTIMSLKTIAYWMVLL